MPKKDRSTVYTFGSIGVASVGGLVFVLAFALPYWVDYKDDVSMSDSSGIVRLVNLHYTYGFWRYCNEMKSDIGDTDTCEAVENHTGVEQATISLIVLTIILYLSTVVNSAFYLSLFKKENLCLYISLLSVSVAGILSTIGVINFGSSDHSITVGNGVSLDFSVSNLSASFWLAVVGCIDAVATAVVIILAIKANRAEQTKEDKKSILSSSASNVSTNKLNFYDDDKISERGSIILDHSNESIADDFSSSCKSSESDSDSTSDSDDSDIDSRFAKLKYKNIRADSAAARRPISNDSLAKKITKEHRRSHSVPFLTPIEQPEANLIDFSDDIARVKVEKILHGVFHETGLETNHPPPSTLISDLSPAHVVRTRSAESDLKRAKTEIIISKTKPEDTGKPDEGVKVEDTVIDVGPRKAASLHFLKKRKTTRSKRLKKRSEDHKVIKDAYSSSTEIPIYPTRKNALPAPWTLAKSKKRKPGFKTTATTLKWVLAARGVYESNT